VERALPSLMTMITPANHTNKVIGNYCLSTLLWPLATRNCLSTYLVGTLAPIREKCEGLLSSISVLVCEAQPIVIEGLQKALAETSDLLFAGSVPKPADALDAIRRTQPNIILIDLSTGLTAALRLLGQLKAAGPTHPILWVVDLPEMDAFRALQMGARGIVKKTLPTATLLECLREVGAGRIWMHESEQVSSFLQRKDSSRLTPREKEVVHLICRGLRNKQIAEHLHITAGTVKVHLMHIFEKTGLKDRLALAVHGRELVGMDVPANDSVSI